MQSHDKVPGRPRDLVGLTRFHSITIGAAVLFLAVLTWRFVSDWHYEGNTSRGVYSLFSAVAMVGLAVYWLRFRRHGI
ncbi:MAG: hypothetical protein KDB53_20005 [Planctomycetes bacterium]|nr:hypothetical protein [Planctomycetota bacterium]